ncbi:MAG: hypothetical protein U1E76_27170 [Planctomycetota bacterium]
MLKGAKDREEFIRRSDQLQQDNWTRTNQLLAERLEWLDRSHAADPRLTLQLLNQSGG